MKPHRGAQMFSSFIAQDVCTPKNVNEFLKNIIKRCAEHCDITVTLTSQIQLKTLLFEKQQLMSKPNDSNIK
ncbi:CLUMA_CG013607, isoform A [Clunio marinus]|uniref:CLUMA_CG013607, isoform A n=1 Tax=Clunio marinus TaxID=568069 RepID=A0A1J1IML6_9DIPT|nr:CLUMA_CG013607, isoform A [Clunio marinus]